MWNALRIVVGIVLLVAALVGMVLTMTGCGSAALSADATCRNNSDCHGARCVYASPTVASGHCVEAIDGRAICGSSLDACCDDGSCIAGHRCVADRCEAVR